jgi:hypothetical protein
MGRPPLVRGHARDAPCTQDAETPRTTLGDMMTTWTRSPRLPPLRGPVALAALICAAALVTACSATAQTPGAAAGPRSPGSPATTRGPSALGSPAAASTEAASTAATAAGDAANTTPLSATAPSGPAQLTGISVGRHPAFDRIVFRFRGGIPGYTIRYVHAVRTDGQGKLVPLRGRAFLQIVFFSASAYQTYHGPSVISPAFPTLLQLKVAGDFEGYLSFGAGLSQRSGFHVLTLTKPDRVVIDVAHAARPAA